MPGCAGQTNGIPLMKEKNRYRLMNLPGITGDGAGFRHPHESGISAFDRYAANDADLAALYN
jgi:hypothetical protein